MLKGQDMIILILLRLRSKQIWTYDVLSNLTGISRSQCHLAIQRLRSSRLLVPSPDNPWHIPAAAFKEFVIHGLKYSFPAKIGSIVNGIPTAHSAVFVSKSFAAGEI